jgi:hypothetical protein
MTWEMQMADVADGGGERTTRDGPARWWRLGEYGTAGRVQQVFPLERTRRSHW